MNWLDEMEQRDAAYPTLTQLCWAPYQEFGIPDPRKEQTEVPAGPVVIRAIGYKDAESRIVIYYEEAR